MTNYVKSEGNLKDCYLQLKEQQADITDAEQLAGLRVSDAKEKGNWKKSEVCTNGAWAANGVVYDGKNVFVTDKAHNPIMKNIREAVEAHSECREFTLGNKTIEKLRDLAKKHPEDARKTGVLLLTDHQGLPVEQLSNRQYSQFLLGQKAEPYGRLCQEADINEIPVYFVPEGDVKRVGKPFGRALWVHDLDSRSSLLGNNGGLVLNYLDGRAFGVSSAQKFSIGNEGIERVVKALEKGIAFEHNGKLYVPVDKRALEQK